MVGKLKNFNLTIVGKLTNFNLTMVGKSHLFARKKKLLKLATNKKSARFVIKIANNNKL